MRLAAFFLPLAPLALVQKAVPGGCQQFVGSAAIVGIVGFVSAAQRDDRRMMKIVVPKAIESITAIFHRAN